MRSRSSSPLDQVLGGISATAGRGLALACGLAILSPAAPAAAGGGGVEAAAAPAVSGCEASTLQDDRAEIRLKVGISDADFGRVELTAEQRRTLAAGYQALVAKCPAESEMQFTYFLLLADDKAVPGEQLVAAAEGFLAADAARQNRRPSQRPRQSAVAERLIDHQVALPLAARLLEESRKEFAEFRVLIAKFDAEASTDAERLRGHKIIADGTDAYLNIVEARLRLQQGDAAAARQRLAAAQATLTAEGKVPFDLEREMKVYEAARQELLAAAPGQVAPPALQLAEPSPELAQQGSFADVDFALEGLPFDDVQGKSWVARDLHGKTWLVNLWATWCGPCVGELPHIQKLYEQLKDRGDVGLVTLNFDKDAARVKPFLERRGYTFPVLLTANKLDQVLSEGIPQNWVLDSGGRVRRKTLGFDAEHPDAFLEVIRKELEQLKSK